MKVLNLAYPYSSDIKFNHQKFPDGQQNTVLLNIDSCLTEQLVDYTYTSRGSQKHWNKIPDTILIKSRLNNWRDLELIICAVASLRELGVEEIHLYTPYIVGARSDRKFEEGGNNYLRDVLAPVINSLGFKTVTCIDPHSDVLEASIKNFRKLSNLELIKWAGLDIRKGCVENKLGESLTKYAVLISPDAGASKKIYKLAEQIGYKGDIITCSKDRDTDGKLSKTVFPFETHKYNGEDFIIIDDICDGGQTFINIARKIKDCFAIRSANQNIKPGKIYLIVTHGIFSKGLKELSKYFDGIYSTNSYSDWDYSDLKAGEKQILKQLNVF